jgi:hypothetical protein
VISEESKCGNSNFCFNTQQYSLDDQKLINKLKKIGLKAKLNKDKNYWRIRLVSKSIERFKQLVGDIAISSMLYKIK